MQTASASDAAIARDLIQAVRSAALATLGEDGGPFASYVNTAPAPDGSPLLLLSSLAVHSRNLARDPRASLLFVREPATGSGNAATRVTLTGRLVRDDNPELRGQFLKRCPDAERYSAFSDFALYRFQITSGHLVAGFGRIATIAGPDLMTTPPQ